MGKAIKPQTGTSGLISSKDADLLRFVTAERQEALENIIVKSALVCNLPVPEDDVLAARVFAWSEALDPIPTERLDEYYLHALHDTEDTYPLSARHILAAWNRRSEERKWAEGEKLLENIP